MKFIYTYTDLQAHSHHVHIKYQSHWYWQEFLPFTLMRPDSSLSPILPDIYRGDNQSTGLSSPHLTRNAGQTQSTACKDCTNAWLVNRLKFARVTACQKYSNRTVSNKKCSLVRFETRKMSKQDPYNIISAVGIRVIASRRAQLAFFSLSNYTSKLHSPVRPWSK